MTDVVSKDISSTVNGMFFGFVVSTALLGITLIQGWIYMNNNHDRWYSRLFVALLVALDFTDTCCGTGILHFYLVSNFGHMAALGITATIVNVDFVLTGVIFFLVHLFFAIRLLKFSKSWWLPSLIMILSTAMLVFNAHSISGSLPLLSDWRLTLIRIEITMFHGLAVATDVLVTLGLSWYLHQTKSEIKSTRMAIHKLIAYIMTRGILITVVQIAHIIMYATDAKNWFFWMSTHLVLSKLYVITMLFILNSRSSLRARMDQVGESDSFQFSIRTPETTETMSTWINTLPAPEASQADMKSGGKSKEMPFISPSHIV